MPMFVTVRPILPIEVAFSSFARPCAVASTQLRNKRKIAVSRIMDTTCCFEKERVSVVPVPCGLKTRLNQKVELGGFAEDAKEMSGRIYFAECKMSRIFFPKLTSFMNEGTRTSLDAREKTKKNSESGRQKLC